jgi:hypothetical protein
MNSDSGVIGVWRKAIGGAVRGSGLIVAGAVCVAVSWGCSATRLTETWVDSSFSDKPIRSLLVLGITHVPENRRMYERSLVARLQEMGVRAVPSYDHIERGKKIEQATIVEAMDQANVDGALVTRVTRVENRSQFAADARTSVSDEIASPMAALNASVNDVYNPAFYQAGQLYSLESQLFLRGGRSMVWSARSESMEADDVERMIQDLVDLLSKDLRRKGLI